MTDKKLYQLKLNFNKQEQKMLDELMKERELIDNAFERKTTKASIIKDGLIMLYLTNIKKKFILLPAQEYEKISKKIEKKKTSSKKALDRRIKRISTKNRLD